MNSIEHYEWVREQVEAGNLEQDALKTEDICLELQEWLEYLEPDGNLSQQVYKQMQAGYFTSGVKWKINHLTKFYKVLWGTKVLKRMVGTVTVILCFEPVQLTWAAYDFDNNTVYVWDQSDD